MTEIHSLISNAYNEVIKFDNRIAEDRLKYSSWVLAAATAGFALSVTQSENVLKDTILPFEVGRWLLVVSSILFALSALFGALVKKYVGEHIQAHRQLMTLILRQDVALKMHPPEHDEADIDTLVQKVTTVGYLPEEKQQRYQAISSNADKAHDQLFRSLFAQQALTGSGYMSLLIAAIG